MAKRERGTVKQVFAPKSENPLIEAKALYDQFKANHGPNQILDQALRLVSHSIKTEWKDIQVKERTFEAVRLTDVVDSACTRVARRTGATAEDKAKEKLVREIHQHLYDCLA